MQRHRTFSENFAFNLAGAIAPAAAAAIALPKIVETIGVDRVGILAIGWAVVGAFSLLDLGIGRALTHETAVLLARNEPRKIPPLVSSALTLLGGLGAVVGLLLALAAGLLARAMNVPAGLYAEASASIMATALTLPFVTTSSGLRGVLEAFGRFDWSSLIRVWVGLCTYVGPLVAVTAFDSVPLAIATIAAARLVATVSMVAMVASLTGGWPSLRGVRGLGTIVTRGIWMSASSVVGAVLAVADRFVLGLTVSIAAVAFYATPQEIVARLTVLPMAVGGILFPALSAAAVRSGPDTGALFVRGLWLTLALLGPLAATAAALAPEWLTAWLGPAFGDASTKVVQWACLTALLQGLAVTPLSLLQASGHTRLAGAIHLIELPLSIAAFWTGAVVAGIEGVAFVLAVRAAVDLAILLQASSRTSPAVAPAVRQWWLPLMLTLTWFVGVMALPSLPSRSGALVVGLALCAAGVWRAMSHDDLARIRLLLQQWVHLPDPPGDGR
jgi:O-antigen/teichoic acid export membrane protein